MREKHQNKREIYFAMFLFSVKKAVVWNVKCPPTFLTAISVAIAVLGVPHVRRLLLLLQHCWIFAESCAHCWAAWALLSSVSSKHCWAACALLSRVSVAEQGKHCWAACALLSKVSIAEKRKHCWAVLVCLLLRNWKLEYNFCDIRKILPSIG